MKIIILGRILQVFFLLLNLKLATHLLSVGENGKLYILLTISAFFVSLFISPIGSYTGRNVIDWSHQKVLLDKFLTYNYFSIVIVVLSAIMLKVIIYFNLFPKVVSECFFILIPLYLQFYGWNQIIIPVFNILGNQLAFIIFTVGTVSLSLFCSIILVYLFEREGIYWFGGQIIGYMVMSIISLIYFKKKYKYELGVLNITNRMDINKLKKPLMFIIPLSCVAILIWSQSQAYKLIIGNYLGSDFLGYLGVGFAIANGISTSFEAIVNQYILPKIYSNMHDAKDEFNLYFSRILNLIIPIYFLMALFVTFSAEYLVCFLLNDSFQQSSIYIIVGIWIEFFRMSGSLMNYNTHFKLNTFKLLLPYGISTIILFIGIFIAINSSQPILFLSISLLFSGFICLFIIYKVVIEDSINLYFRYFIYMMVFVSPVFLFSVSMIKLSLFYIMGFFLIEGILFYYIMMKHIERFENV